MVFLFVIRAAGSELDGETFHIQDADAVRAGIRAARKVDDIFSLASREMRDSARAHCVQTFPSMRAYLDAEEAGFDAILDCIIGDDLRAVAS